VNKTAYLMMVALAGCQVAEVEITGPGAALSGPRVVINEFTPGTSGRIELFNAGDAAADLSGWQVDDLANGGYAPKSVGTAVTLPAGGYLLLSYAGVNTASADQVRVVDATGAEVDGHTNFYAGSSLIGLCFGRLPDGGAWAAGAIPCSLGGSNCQAGGCPTPDLGTAPDLTPPADLAPQADLTPASDLAQAQGTTLTLDRRDRILLSGMVVTPDVAFAGEVLIEGDTITCVAASCAQQPGAVGASRVQTDGVILPGLIDAHNHVLFNIFDESDWSPTKIYANHNQWPNDARYGAMVDAKQYLNGEGSPVSLGCEMDKYGELKGLIAGTTSIQGSANPANKACYGSLARTIDQSPNDLPIDKIQTATLFPSTKSADGVCNNLDSGKTEAFVIHIAEGVDATSLAEFGKLGTVSTTPGCLYQPKTTIIHGTALGDPELTLMGQAGMSLVWSPRSNVFLYGAGQDLTKTTRIPLALQRGVNVALAPDWSIGGSQNLLDELRFADQVDNTIWGDVLSPKLLTQMVTTHAARALGVSAYVGSLEPGKKADVLIIRGDPTHPYDALLAATPLDVQLVMVGGVPRYGDLVLEPLGPPAPGCETLSLCGGSKFACVAETGGTASNKLGQSYAEIAATLASGMQAYDDLDLTQWNFAPIAPLLKCPAP